MTMQLDHILFWIGSNFVGSAYVGYTNSNMHIQCNKSNGFNNK